MKNLAVTALMMLALPACAAAEDYNFQVPGQCHTSGEDRVTGADAAETADPPVVTITYNEGRKTLTAPVTLGYNSFSKLWSAAVALPPLLGDVYLVTTTYTPFLQSSYAIRSDIEQPFVLPPPAYNSQAIFGKVTITVYDQLNQPLPNAFLEMAPDFGGSSPYTLQADGSAKVDVYCLTVFPGGNPATVLDSNHNVLYATNVIFNISGEGIARPAR
jgi:hypothetical protein